MSEKKLSRRSLLKNIGGLSAGLAATGILGACQPKVVEVEKVVEKEVTVVVTEEKIVKEAVEVEKEVTRVVEAKAAAAGKEVRFLTRAGPLGLFMKEFSSIYADKSGGAVSIKIEEGNWADVSTKLMTSAVAGTLADVFWQPYFYLPYHIANGVVQEMDDLKAASGVDDSIWYPWALDMETFEGKLYGLPMGVMTGYNTIVYNREILDNAGVETPDGPNNTWADLINIAKGIKENTGLWGIDIGHWWWGTETVCRNFDSRIVEFMGTESHFSDEATQVPLKMIYDLANVDEVMPTSASMEGNRTKMFAAGKLAMMVNCAADVVCGMADAIGGRFPFGYTCLPTADNGLMGTQQQADSVNIFSGSEVAEEAFGLCAEIAGVDASIWACTTTGMTPGACPAAWESEDVAVKHPWYGWEGEWFKTNVPEPPPMPQNLRFNEMNTVWGAEWNPVKNGERPYNQETIDDIDAKFQKVLDEPRPA